jgi:hypothetical protein
MGHVAPTPKPALGGNAEEQGNGDQACDKDRSCEGITDAPQPRRKRHKLKGDRETSESSIRCPRPRGPG